MKEADTVDNMNTITGVPNPQPDALTGYINAIVQVYNQTAEWAQRNPIHGYTYIMRNKQPALRLRTSHGHVDACAPTGRSKHPKIFSIDLDESAVVKLPTKDTRTIRAIWAIWNDHIETLGVETATSGCSAAMSTARNNHNPVCIAAFSL